MIDLITSIFNSIQNNSIVTGIFGTTVFAGLVVYLRQVPIKMFYFFLNFFTVKVVFEQQQKVSSNQYGEFRINRAYTAICRELSKLKRFSFSKTEDCVDDTNADHNENSVGNITFIGALNTVYWTFVNGIFASYFVTESSNQHVRSFIITIRFYSINKSKVYNTVSNIINESIASDNKTGINYFFNTGGGNWSDLIKKYQYSQSIYMLTNTQQQVYKRVAEFINSEQKYRDLCKPYHLGFIFYGKPGCGKSQFVKKLAEDFNLPVYVLNFGSITSDGILTYLIRGIESFHAIVLIEDIDRFRFQGENKQVIKNNEKIEKQKINKEEQTEQEPLERWNDPEIDSDTAEIYAVVREINNDINNQTSDTKGPTFSTVLNTLDGIYGTDNGLIFIATTNHFETLDPAFIRPGRFDYHFVFDYMNYKEICNFVRIQFNKTNGTPVNEYLENKLNTRLRLPISIVSNACFESKNIEECIQKLNNYASNK